MTFDAWYRARMSHLAPGIDIEYVSRSSGSSIAPYWLIDAEAVPGPLHGAPAGLAALNQYGFIASVDESSGNVVGPDQHSGQTWLDQFRNGVPAWPLNS